MKKRDLSRVVAFSDGVIAVAITLLVLNIEVPTVPEDDLPGALEDLLSSLGAYLLAFALVGRYWIIHHNLYEKLRDFDGRLMLLNLLFLMLIALMPFAANLIDAYPDTSIAVAVMGGILGLAGVVHWLATVYSLKRGFIAPEHAEESRWRAHTAALGITSIFLLSVPVAFVSPSVAKLLWLGTLVLRYPLTRLAPHGRG